MGTCLVRVLSLQSLLPTIVRFITQPFPKFQSSKSPTSHFAPLSITTTLPMPATVHCWVRVCCWLKLQTMLTSHLIKPFRVLTRFTRYVKSHLGINFSDFSSEECFLQTDSPILSVDTGYVTIKDTRHPVTVFATSQAVRVTSLEGKEYFSFEVPAVSQRYRSKSFHRPSLFNILMLFSFLKSPGCQFHVRALHGSDVRFAYCHKISECRILFRFRCALVGRTKRAFHAQAIQVRLREYYFSIFNVYKA